MLLQKSLVNILLAGLLLAISPEGLLAKTDTPLVFDDGRFAGFNAQEYVIRNHALLTVRSEAISHWAAYYRLNPLLLAHIVDHQFIHHVPSIDEVQQSASQWNILLSWSS